MDAQLSPIRPGGRNVLQRSPSDVTSSGRLHHSSGRQHGHHHHHHYSHSLHLQSQQPRKERKLEKRVTVAPQAASQGRHSLDMPRSEGVTPFMSPVQSRRQSVMIAAEDIKKVQNDEAKAQIERENAIHRAEGLKESIEGLGSFSNAATRRLDETYYAILEKTSALQNTIAALKDLAETSHEIYEGFEKESQGLESDILTQLSGLGQFNEQQDKIDSLQGRITTGREKIQALTRRVDVVRERVEGWEKADRHWQEKTRKRLRIIWSVTSVIVTVVVALLIHIYKKENEEGDLLLPPDKRFTELPEVVLANYSQHALTPEHSWFTARASYSSTAATPT